MRQVAAVPDTNTILYWLIPSGYMREGKREIYESVENFMDDKVEDWDVYISPTVKREFGKRVVDSRAIEEADFTQGSYNRILDEIERETNKKLEDVQPNLYFITEDESDTEKVEKERELFTNFQRIFPDMEKNEKDEFNHKSLQPGSHDIEYLAEAEYISPKADEREISL